PSLYEDVRVGFSGDLRRSNWRGWFFSACHARRNQACAISIKHTRLAGFVVSSASRMHPAACRRYSSAWDISAASTLDATGTVLGYRSDCDYSMSGKEPIPQPAVNQRM